MNGGCCTHINRQYIVRHRWPVATQYALHIAINAGDFIFEIARAGKLGQLSYVDVHVVVAVMACYIARQHAGIRGVGIGANDRQAHAGHGLHGEHMQHHHVAVATAHQNNIAYHGGGRLLHSGHSE